MGQAIYLATGLEIKKARLLNWDLYKAPRTDKPGQVPLSQVVPNTLAFVKIFSYLLCDAYPTEGEVSLPIH